MPQNNTVQEYTLQPKYIALIKSGKKTVEGRINAGGFAKLKKGQRIKFFNGKNPDDFVLIEVKQINTYKGFREMLDSEGIGNVLPGIQTTDEGVSIYENIPSYKERAKRSGVLGIKVQVI